MCDAWQQSNFQSFIKINCNAIVFVFSTSTSTSLPIIAFSLSHDVSRCSPSFYTSTHFFSILVFLSLSLSLSSCVCLFVISYFVRELTLQHSPVCSFEYIPFVDFSLSCPVMQCNDQANTIRGTFQTIYLFLYALKYVRIQLWVVWVDFLYDPSIIFHANRVCVPKLCLCVHVVRMHSYLYVIAVQLPLASSK